MQPTTDTKQGLLLHLPHSNNLLKLLFNWAYHVIVEIICWRKIVGLQSSVSQTWVHNYKGLHLVHSSMDGNIACL
jgi:hypothetical protein